MLFRFFGVRLLFAVDRRNQASRGFSFAFKIVVCSCYGVKELIRRLFSMVGLECCVSLNLELLVS